MPRARPKRSLRRGLHLRAARIWWPTWRRRGVFLAGGLAVGACAVAMALLADQAQLLFKLMREHSPALPFLITPFGFGLAAWMTRRFFPNAGGSGIPQVIAAHGTADAALRHTLVSLRIGVGKILLLLLGLACGASSGREGPTVQVGASIMVSLARMQPHRQPGLLIAGSAAGVAAAFNAPLAGIIFGIEEMSRSFETRTSGLILGTVIAAGLTSLGVLGDYTYFGTTAETLPFGRAWAGLLVAGVVCGLAGGLFSRTLIVVAQGLPPRVRQVLNQRSILVAALCGLGVAACGAASGGAVFGTGYEQAKMILAGTALPPDFAPMKILATLLSSISGIPGGIFAPSLAVGAGIAQDLQAILPAMPIGALTILCMAGYLSGVVQAPMTSFVIVSEMTANHALIIPIMISSVVANAASKLVCPEGVYHALAKGYLPPGGSAAHG